MVFGIRKTTTAFGFRQWEVYNKHAGTHPAAGSSTAPSAPSAPMPAVPAAPARKQPLRGKRSRSASQTQEKPRKQPRSDSPDVATTSQPPYTSSSNQHEYSPYQSQTVQLPRLPVHDMHRSFYEQPHSLPNYGHGGRSEQFGYHNQSGYPTARAQVSEFGDSFYTAGLTDDIAGMRAKSHQLPDRNAFNQGQFYNKMRRTYGGESHPLPIGIAFNQGHFPSNVQLPRRSGQPTEQPFQPCTPQETTLYNNYESTDSTSLRNTQTGLPLQGHACDSLCDNEQGPQRQGYQFGQQTQRNGFQHAQQCGENSKIYATGNTLLPPAARDPRDYNLHQASSDIRFGIRGALSRQESYTLINDEEPAWEAPAGGREISDTAIEAEAAATEQMPGYKSDC
jgi:hypothetical protein